MEQNQYMMYFLKCAIKYLGASLESFLLKLFREEFSFASYGVRPDAVGECQAMMARDFQMR
jgi:hypothetical protein